ncbi:Transposon, En/Spm-like protein [Corchorus capsularis]|uniref:Transposon, En/Spm-like protein n=1 Tax=Corchorus capsularis TaxID=210143 RepID=A0A1R3GIT6_COCAP|nr:Transposon, En/Spm-like protein [Corchorus capsularis]
MSSLNEYQRMVMDSGLYEFRGNENESNNENVFEEMPNPSAARFFSLLKDADEEVWEGCTTHSKLSAVSQLLNCKSESNMSDVTFDRLLSIIKDLLPGGDKLPPSFYRTKKMMSNLGLGYQKIHACVNNCMLFYKDSESILECSVCGHPRYKSMKMVGRKQKGIPYKVLRYLALTPKLRRLYMSTKIAEHMTWHAFNRSPNGELRHPVDSEAWKHFDRTYPWFAQEVRNVRLGLCTDGFSPFGPNAKPYSCWPVIITVYNLPPWMCMKQPYMSLNMIIPGPKNPGKHIDVFLRPLIDELSHLWNVGVETYDAFRKQNFKLHAALLWTINDFPAYGMLSGWSTHGRLSCPYCMENTKAFQLKHGRKTSFFDCHQQFLPPNHPYRKQRDKFSKRVENDEPLERLSGEVIFHRVNALPDFVFGTESGKQTFEGFGVTHNWVKKSIFWELDYWHTNLVRHNLDVMHVEKNVFDNVFNTVMDVKGKTKDNVKARMDLPLYCKRPDLELQTRDGKVYKPIASYTLSSDQKKLVYEWVQQIRFLHHLKKKVRNRNYVEGSICEAYLIEEISTFCSHYFDINVQTRLNRAPRNDDGGDMDPKGRLSIFTHLGRPLETKGSHRYLNDVEYKAAETYVLMNREEIAPFIEETPTISDRELEKYRENNFSTWLKQVVNSNDVDSRIYELARGPSHIATFYKGFFVNGFKFHTELYGQHKKTMNSGVWIKGSCYNDNERDFYGVLVDIIELEYLGDGNKIVLFKCRWFDIVRGVVVHPRHGLVKVNHKSRLASNEPFVLAAQALQVCYSPYPSNKGPRQDWWVVFKVKARSRYDWVSNHEVDDVSKPESIYQEDLFAPSTIHPSKEVDREGILISGYMEEVGVIQQHDEEEESEEESEEELEDEEEEDILESEEEPNDEVVDYMSNSSYSLSDFIVSDLIGKMSGGNVKKLQFKSKKKRKLTHSSSSDQPTVVQQFPTDQTFMETETQPFVEPSSTEIPGDRVAATNDRNREDGVAMAAGIPKKGRGSNHGTTTPSVPSMRTLPTILDGSSMNVPSNSVLNHVGGVAQAAANQNTETQPSVESSSTEIPGDGVAATNNGIREDGVAMAAGIPRRGRGPNRGTATPSNPSMRKQLTILDRSAFSDPKVVTNISSILKGNYNHPWPTWSQVDKRVKYLLWKTFQDLYTWEVHENNLVEDIWDLKCDERLRDGFCKARKRARELARTKDWNALKPFNPKWIPNPVWVRLIEDVWSKEEWEKNSEIASANRKSSADGSISKHAGGSRSFHAHKEALRLENNGREPTHAEVFEKTHKRKNGKFVDSKSKRVCKKYKSLLKDKYGENVTQQPQFDADFWKESIGKVNYGHLYGFGTLQNPKELLGSSSTNTEAPSMNASSQLPQPSEELMNELVNQCLAKLSSMGVIPIVPPTSGGVEVPSPSNVANQSASALDTDQIRLSASPGNIERTSSSPNHSIPQLDSELNHENVSNEGEGTRSEDDGNEWFDK